MNVYISEHVVRCANQAVAEHTPRAHDERCPLCRTAAPCRPLADALHTLGRLGRLPKRARGATDPARITARRVRVRPQ